jgi:N-acetylglucosaminyldiphosphoundecaprenol N-acetyl-beta-D-mannosaminyltransferase
MNQRLNILDIWVDTISSSEAEEEVLNILRNGRRPHCIFASNPEKNFSVPKNPVLYNVYRTADILLPDGIGMVLAAKFLYGQRMKRIPGVEFMKTICGLAAAERKTVFIYGAREAVNREAVERLQHEFPSLRIAGRSNGYIQKAEMPDLIRQINTCRAKVLFLALGSPRQEMWFARHKDQLSHVVLVQGIGGTLDTIVGTVKRAPRLWCRLNLEWLYRLLKQPQRAGRQRLLPLFAMQVVKQKLKA